MITCGNCGTKNEESDAFCGNCGQFLEWVAKREDGAPPPADDAAAQRQAEEDAARREAEEAAAEAAAAEAQRLADEEAARKRAEEEAAAAAEAQRLAEEEAERRRAEEAAAAEAQRLADEEAARKQAEEEAAAAEVQRLADEEAARKQAEEEAAAAAAAAVAAETQRLADEEAARKQAEEEAARKQAEEEAAAAAAAARPAARRGGPSKPAAVTIGALPVAEPPPEPEASMEAQPPAVQPGVRPPSAQPEPAWPTQSSATAVPPIAPPPSGQPPAVKPTTQPEQPPEIKPTLQPEQPPAIKPTDVRPVEARPQAGPTSDRRVPQPGDRICPRCSEANDPARKFCRRCGQELVSAQVVAPPPLPWWKRLFRREPKQYAAGERTSSMKTGPRSGTGMGRIRARQLIEWVIGLLVLLGVIGYFAIPTVQQVANRAVSTGVNTVQRFLNPRLEPMRPASIQASEQADDHPAASMFDTYGNTDWRASSSQPTVSLRFDEPFDLGALVVYSGAKEKFTETRRPAKLQLTFPDGTSTVLDLKDDNAKQTITVDKSGIDELEITVLDAYGDPGTPVTVSEIIVFAKR